jgi:uncharacterized membrane protein YagU involved in acid resistance
MTNVVHWATGLAWGAQFGIVAGSTRRRPWALGLLLGPLVWLAGYVILPMAKLYKPIWEYDRKTLAKDLSAHIVYGAATAATFAALTSLITPSDARTTHSEPGSPSAATGSKPRISRRQQLAGLQDEPFLGD